MQTQKAKRNLGFTIVELLIVIVVIAILAAISIVAYTGIQARARDTTRKNDLAAIAKALEVRAIDNTHTLGHGNSCTSTSSTSGWFSQTGMSLSGTNYGSNSAAHCLSLESNTSVIYKDSSGATSCASGAPDTCFAYMYCSAGNYTYIFAHLETVNTTSTSVDGAGCQTAYDTTWGMNYFVRATKSGN